MNNKKSTVRGVVENLDALNADEVSRIEDYLANLAETKSQPWFIRGCAGISAWFASLFIIGFLAFAEVITNDMGAIGVGLMLCGTGVAISRSRRDSDFATQGALAICLAGQLLFVFGLSELRYGEPLTLTVLLIIALETLLIWFYESSLLRFISTLVIISSVSALIYDLDVTNIMPFLVIILLAGSIYLWENELFLATSNYSNIYRPVGTGLSIGALALVSLPVVQILNISLWWVSTVGLLVILLWVIRTIAIANNLELRSSGIGAAFGGGILLAVPGIQIPGLVASMAVLIHSFHRGNKFLLGVALAFMTYFVTLFYYDLEITLLQKSFALLGGGIAFWVIRFFTLRLMFRNDREQNEN